MSNYIVKLGERQIEVTPFDAAVQMLRTEINDPAWSSALAELQPDESFHMWLHGRHIAMWPKGEEQKEPVATNSP